MKLLKLFNLYDTWVGNLADMETITEALKTLPPEMVVFNQLVPTGQGLPPTKRDMTCAERIQELERDLPIVRARVEQLRRSLIKELGGIIKDDFPIK